MRQILVSYANRHRAAKRGGGNKVALEEAAGAVEQQQSEVDLVALNEALERLTALDPRAARIVELRFFAGLTEEEIAEVLGFSEATVKRDWRMAKAALSNELRAGNLS